MNEVRGRARAPHHSPGERKKSRAPPGLGDCLVIDTSPECRVGALQVEKEDGTAVSCQIIGIAQVDGGYLVAVPHGAWHEVLNQSTWRASPSRMAGRRQLAVRPTRGQHLRCGRLRLRVRLQRSQDRSNGACSRRDAYLSAKLSKVFGGSGQSIPRGEALGGGRDVGKGGMGKLHRQPD